MNHIIFQKKDNSLINWKLSNKNYFRQYKLCKKDYIYIHRWIYVLKKKEKYEIEKIIEENIWDILLHLFDWKYYVSDRSIFGKSVYLNEKNEKFIFIRGPFYKKIKIFHINIVISKYSISFEESFCTRNDFTKPLTFFNDKNLKNNNRIRIGTNLLWFIENSKTPKKDKNKILSFEKLNEEFLTQKDKELYKKMLKENSYKKELKQIYKFKEKFEQNKREYEISPNKFNKLNSYSNFKSYFDNNKNTSFAKIFWEADISEILKQNITIYNYLFLWKKLSISNEKKLFFKDYVEFLINNI